MVRFQVAAIAIANLALYSYAPLASAIDHSNCESIGNLGLDNLDRFDYSVDMDIDENCSYVLSFKFKHDSALPVPTEADHCNPAVQPPVMASDGLPYYAFRWAYESVPKSIKKATGIDHLSIDFNPCGHPPMDVFTNPHYDLHIYLVDPKYRACMTCDLAPFAPVCNPAPGAQTTSNGRGEFILYLLKTIRCLPTFSFINSRHSVGLQGSSMSILSLSDRMLGNQAICPRIL